jgi:hypothetical protein
MAAIDARRCGSALAQFLMNRKDPQMMIGGRRLVWCVEQKGAVITAQFENFGTSGIAVRVWWNGHLYFSEIYRTRDRALMASEQLRIGFNAAALVH